MIVGNTLEKRVGVRCIMEHNNHIQNDVRLPVVVLFSLLAKSRLYAYEFHTKAFQRQVLSIFLKRNDFNSS